MRISCNGCRVLRKGCSDNCSIKSCLQWIKSPESQANATVFLAKFYGRAGLVNLINAGPSHLRPGVFRSLLYEACGRIVNPIYGATGLLVAGNWQLCQAAVDAVLTGSPIKEESVDSAASTICPPLKACDIRHVSKKQNETAPVKATCVRNRHGMKTSEKLEKPTVKPENRMESPDVDDAARVMWSWSRKHEEIDGSPSRESGLSNPSGHSGNAADDSGSSDRTASPIKPEDGTDDGELELELTLGFEPILKRRKIQPVDDAMCPRNMM